MPRRRTISCKQCGFMQLKRDEQCEQCGCMTAREKRKMFIQIFYGTAVCAMAAGFYFYINTFAKSN